MKYQIKLCIELGEKICKIERVGKRDYKIKNIRNHDTSNMSFNEVNQLAIKQHLEDQLKELSQCKFDPDFSIDHVNFKIIQIKSLTGMKGIFILQSDIQQNNSMIMNGLGHNFNLGQNLRFFCKMHIFSSIKQIKVYRRELEIVKQVAKNNIGPDVSLLHQNQRQPDLLLSFDSDSLNKATTLEEAKRKRQQLAGDQKVPLMKYLIITKELKNGFFLDDLLNFRDKQPQILINPLARFYIIDKILAAYQKLERLGVYHGQIIPSHIYVDNFQDVRAVDISEINLLDFSQAIKVKTFGQYGEPEQRPSRFQCALDCDDNQVQKINKTNCFYLHKNYSFSKAFRYFHHPILHYLRINHVDKNIDKLHFDIRDTQIYSLLILIMIIASPDIGVQQVMKSLMQNYTDDKYKSIDHRQKINIDNDQNDGSFNKKPLQMAKDFILKAYDNHNDIQGQFKMLLEAIEVNFERSCSAYQKHRSTPKSKKKGRNKNKRIEQQQNQKNHQSELIAKNISELSDILRPFVGKIIEAFKNIGGKYNPHRPTMAVLGGKGGLKFGASGGRKTVKARTFAGRRTMMVDKNPENQEKRYQAADLSIFDRFFGQQWILDLQNQKKKQMNLPGIDIGGIKEVNSQDDSEKQEDQSKLPHYLLYQYLEGLVQSKMSIISGRQKKRSNQLGSDNDLNSIKATINLDKDQVADYQPQQSSRRNKKDGKKYLGLDDGRESPDQDQKGKYQKLNINLLGPSGQNYQNAQYKQREQNQIDLQKSNRSQLPALHEAMIQNAMRSKTPRKNNKDYDEPSSSRRYLKKSGNLAGQQKDNYADVDDNDVDDDDNYLEDEDNNENDSDSYYSDDDDDQ